MSDNDNQNNESDNKNNESDNKNNQQKKKGRRRKRRYRRYNDEDNQNDKKRNKNLNDDKYNKPLFRIFFGSPPILNNENNNEKKEEEIVDNDDDKYFETDDKLYPIEKKVNNLDDLIQLGESYKEMSLKKYVINLKVLNRCVPILKELKNMIGMRSIKDRIIDLFFFYLQNFMKNESGNDMLHTIIEGSPGSGKTEVSKILAKLYHKLGIVKTEKFIIAKRSDLIGKYLGHTAAKTQEVFNKAKNGVLFIDEAYSLGNAEGRDSFSKECIDTINQNLTEKKGELIVIIAGYKKQLSESFFSYNPGLLRRFPFRFTIGEYSPEDLMEIYIKMLNDDKWELDEKNKIKLEFFKKNKDFFPFNGGDMETLWHFTKMVHSRRVFGLDLKLRKKITNEDLENAFKLFITNEEVKNRKEGKELREGLLASLYC